MLESQLENVREECASQITHKDVCPIIVQPRYCAKLGLSVAVTPGTTNQSAVCHGEVCLQSPRLSLSGVWKLLLLLDLVGARKLLGSIGGSDSTASPRFPNPQKERRLKLGAMVLSGDVD